MPLPLRPSRWRFRLVVGFIVLAIVGAALAGWFVARTSAPPSGPVILVSIDALRADHLPAYGYTGVRTPAIDALAADGILFERAYAHVPLTLPSHVSLLSGRLPFETGVRDGTRARVPPRPLLLPQLLHRRGFDTAGIVSAARLGRETGLGQAFDFFDDDVPVAMPWVPREYVGRDGAGAVETAKRWIDQRHDERFFLLLHLDEPHAPYVPPPRFGRYQVYDGEIAYADEIVGRFLQFLKDRGMYEQALIVLVSDHGESLGAHGEAEHGLFLYDETLRTPLIVKMPWQEGAGRRVTAAVQHIDLTPTILDIMGLPRPSGLRGRSLRPVLESADEVPARQAIYAESVGPRLRFGWSELRSITDGRRYILAPKPELFDLGRDRAGRENVIDREQAEAAALRAALEKLVAAAPPPAQPLTDEDVESLLQVASDGLTPVDVLASAVPAAPVDPKDRLGVIDRCRRAAGAAAEGRFREAASGFREALSVDPGMPEAWRELGAALLALGQAPEALDAFRHAVRVDPEDGQAVVGMAKALRTLGKLDEAKRTAEIGAKLDAASAYETLTRIELERPNLVQAREAAQLAQQADPELPMPAFVEGVDLFATEKYDEALPRFEDALNQSASRRVPVADVRLFAGECLARLGRRAEAEAQLRDELKWFPMNVRARGALASLLVADGRLEAAAAEAEELLRVQSTAEGYAAAMRVFSSLANRKRVVALRAEARKLFGEHAIRAAEQR